MTIKKFLKACKYLANYGGCPCQEFRSASDWPACDKCQGGACGVKAKMCWALWLSGRRRIKNVRKSYKKLIKT